MSEFATAPLFCSGLREMADAEVPSEFMGGGKATAEACKRTQDGSTNVRFQENRQAAEDTKE